MKKCAKWLAVFIAVVCLGAAMAACGDKGETYNFKEMKIEMAEGESNMMDAMAGSMSNLFKDSTLKVTDKKLKWDIKNVGSQTLKATKEGDKYVLSGDYTKQIEEMMTKAYTSMGINVDVKASWHGIKTEEGYEIVFEMTLGAMSMNGITIDGFTQISKYIFTKA